MDAQFFVFFALILGLAAGIAFGWYVGARPVGEWKARHAEREGVCSDLTDKLGRMVPELATMSERAARADALAADLDAARNDREALGREVAEFRRDAVNFAEREKLLLEARETLLKEFQNAGAKVLGEAQKSLLDTAHERFGHAEKANEARIKALLEPVDKTLADHKAHVSKMQENWIDGFGRLGTLLESVRTGQERVVEGANRITNSIRGATKMVGDWGELQFQNLLESCGLLNKTDFECQVSLKGNEGVLRPDGVISIPGGRKLVVDVKNVFNTYEAASKAETDEQRIALLRGLGREIRGHVDALASKRYQDHVPGSADFVIMFIPGEHVLYSALSVDAGLMDYALQRKVVISSPLNFMSIALTVSTIWRQANAHADAEEITRLGKELYDRLGTVAGFIASLRKSLHSTNEHFDSLVGSFDKNLRVSGERFQKLAVDTSAKDLRETLPLNQVPRRLRNFPDHEEPSGLVESTEASERESTTGYAEPDSPVGYQEPAEATLIDGAKAGTAQDN